MTRQERAKKIEAAAYKVLEEKGFKGASMLAIAKEAKASNETLYGWYGDKIGLFSSMIKSNAQLVERDLGTARQQGEVGLSALVHVGASLLAMVTSERAIALNRAAAGDVTGELGRALGEEGRNRVLPILVGLLQEAYGDTHDVSEHLECYVSLLLGDLQIRRAIGTASVLSQKDVALRSQRAVERLQLIFRPPSLP